MVLRHSCHPDKPPVYRGSGFLQVQVQEDWVVEEQMVVGEQPVVEEQLAEQLDYLDQETIHHQESEYEVVA